MSTDNFDKPDLLQRIEKMESQLAGIIRRNASLGRLSNATSEMGDIDFRAVDENGNVRVIMSAVNLIDEFGINGYLATFQIDGVTASFWVDADTGEFTALNGAMTIGANGIVANLLSDVLTQIADDGTVYRKGRLGMRTLDGRTAPSFGVSYEDNSNSAELLTNGGFETGDFTGWTDVSGTWEILTTYSGTLPNEGSYFAHCDTLNGEKKQIVNVTAGQILEAKVSMSASPSAGTDKLYLDFYTGAGGTGTLVQSILYNFVPISGAGWLSKTFILSVPIGAASVAFRIVDGSTYFTPTALFDACSLKVNPAANWLGFEPIDGKLVSNMLDGGDAVGQIPVGAMTVPRVGGVKDKLTATGGAAGNVNVGTHYLITTFVDAYGETDADLTQASSVAIATSAKTVALSVIPLGKWGTIARKIYATVAGATSTDPTAYYLLTTISDNTTATATYNVSDANLVAGALIPTVNTTGSRPIFPRFVDIPVKSVITTVTLTEALSTAYRSGYVLEATAANANINDTFKFSFILEAGSYTFTHVGTTRTEGGFATYYIDGVSAGSLDWYTSPGVNYVKQSITNVVILTSGYHVLEVKVESKNALSADYRLAFSELYFTPSAY